MKLNVCRNRLEIVPEGGLTLSGVIDERDTAFIEEVLGLKKEGDSVLLVRKNAMGLSCIAYLETQRRGE